MQFQLVDGFHDGSIPRGGWTPIRKQCETTLQTLAFHSRRSTFLNKQAIGRRCCASVCLTVRDASDTRYNLALRSLLPCSSSVRQRQERCQHRRHGGSERVARRPPSRALGRSGLGRAAGRPRGIACGCARGKQAQNRLLKDSGKAPVIAHSGLAAAVPVGQYLLMCICLSSCRHCSGYVAASLATCARACSQPFASPPVNQWMHFSQ